MKPKKRVKLFISKYLRVCILVIIFIIFLNGQGCMCGEDDDNAGDGKEDAEDMLSGVSGMLGQLSEGLGQNTDLLGGEGDVDWCESCPSGAEGDRCRDVCNNLAKPDLSGIRLDTESGYIYSYEVVMPTIEDTVYYIYFESNSKERHELDSGTASADSVIQHSGTDIELDVEYHRICMDSWPGEGQKTACENLQSSSAPIVSPDDAPEGATIDGPGEFTILQGTTFVYTLDAVDPDCEDEVGCFSFTYISDPPLSSNFYLAPALGKITFTPDQGDVGDYTITLTATDNDANQDSVIIILHVVDVNDAPEIIIPVITVIEDSFTEINLDDYVTDVDGDTEFTYSHRLIGSPSHLTVEITDNIAKITPDPDWNGEENVEFTVRDSSLSVDTTAKVIVEPATDAPWVDPIPVITVNEDFGTASRNIAQYKNDDDDTGEDLVWGVVYFDETMLSASVEGDRLNLESVDNVNGETVITLSLTDSESNVVEYDLDVKIVGKNDAPELSEIPEIVVTDAPFAMNLNDFVSDPDNTNDQLRFNFRFNLPEVTIDYDSASQTALFTKNEGYVVGEKFILVMVTDFGLTDSQWVRMRWESSGTEGEVDIGEGLT